MSKAEKCWVFGMILMLCVKPQEIPTVWGSLSNIFCYIFGLGFFVAMVWSAVKGEGK